MCVECHINVVRQLVSRLVCVLENLQELVIVFGELLQNDLELCPKFYFLPFQNSSKLPL
jgi:hypothetical protein